MLPEITRISFKVMKSIKESMTSGDFSRSLNSRLSTCVLYPALFSISISRVYVHTGFSAESYCNTLKTANRGAKQLMLAYWGFVASSTVLVGLLLCFCTCCCSCWCWCCTMGRQCCNRSCTALGFGWYVTVLLSCAHVSNGQCKSSRHQLEPVIMKTPSKHDA